jgi:hypothetical protein
MPFESKAQQRFMFATKPDTAKKWAKETPSMKSLPEKKHPSINPEGRKLDKQASPQVATAFMRGFVSEIIKTAGPSAGRLARLFSSAAKAKSVATPGMGLGRKLLLGGGATAAAAGGGGALGMRSGKKKGYETGTNELIDVAQQARQLGRREGVLAYHQALQSKMRGGQ